MSGVAALTELTRVRLAELVRHSILVLPFGAVEQHGPHLPFGTDFLAVDTIARGAADRAGDEAPLVLAPAVPYGSSDHHVAVGGALSASAAAFEAYARDLLLSAAGSGFRRVFVVNGHGGNDALLRVAAQVAGGEQPLAVAGGSYWTLAHDELRRIMPPPLLVPGHAGRFETSLVHALRPETVVEPPSRESWETEELTSYWHEDRAAWKRIDGYTDSPADADAEQGRVLLEAIVAAVARCIVEFDRETRERGTT